MIMNPKAAAPAAPKASKPSILGLLFNPRIGDSVAPMRETNRAFLHLLAGVFAVYGMFPKDHPAFKDNNAPLSLFYVMGTAWNTLLFTRDGLPKVLMFFTIAGMMAFSAIALVIALFSMFIGHAHAADYSVFSPESQDVAQSLLGFIFGGTSGAAFPSELENPFIGGFAFQNALFYALGTYSNAILIVAALILMYRLASMVMETAAHGVPMGKRASQVWAPIRLVVAIGLLVPINYGLNCGQYIVVKVASLGSGMASHVWDTVLQSLGGAAGNTVVSAGPILDFEAADMILMNACMTAWNKRDTQQGGKNQMQAPSGKQSVVGNIGGTKYSYSGPTAEDKDICGWYFIPNGLGGVQISVPSQLSTAGQTMTNIIPPDLSDSSSSSGGTSVTYDPKFRDGVAALQQSVMQAMSFLSASEISLSDSIANLSEYGWIMAGTYVNTIASLQSDIAAKASSLKIMTHKPLLGEEGGHWKGFRKTVDADMKAFKKYQTDSLTESGSTGDDDSVCAAMTGLVAGSEGGMFDIYSGIVDYVAGHFGVWQGGKVACGGSIGSSFGLGIQIGASNPLAAMAALGQACIQSALEFENLAIEVNAGGGLLGTAFGKEAGEGVSKLAPAISSLFSFAAMMFFSSGFSLAYLLPLMPFMRFFFASLSWLAAVLEAVVAIPLVALAHLNPEGEGLPGQSAKNAYFFTFNIFLRPTLIVFGMVFGLMLFMLAVSFLNFAYATAVGSTALSGASFGVAAIGKVIYQVLYIVILYVCANHAFQLIDHIPQHALTWMGAQAQAIPKMGDVDKIEGIGQMAASYVGNQMMTTAAQAGGAAGSAAGGLMNNLNGGTKGHTTIGSGGGGRPAVTDGRGGGGGGDGSARPKPKGPATD